MRNGTIPERCGGGGERTGPGHEDDAKSASSPPPASTTLRLAQEKETDVLLKALSVKWELFCGKTIVLVSDLHLAWPHAPAPTLPPGTCLKMVLGVKVSILLAT